MTCICCEIITTIRLVNIHHLVLFQIKEKNLFFLVMKTVRIYSQNSVQIPSRGINYGHHVVHYILRTYLIGESL